MLIHSTTDVVTNSSTTLYTVPHSRSVDATYEMLRQVIDALGLDLPCDVTKCFTVTYELDENYFREWCECREDDYENITADRLAVLKQQAPPYLYKLKITHGFTKEPLTKLTNALSSIFRAYESCDY